VANAWQRRPSAGIVPLSIANERLDDLESGAGLALGPPAPEIGVELALRAQNFCVACGLLHDVLPQVFGFVSPAHGSITRLL
jgi:hypothetical protein